MLGIVPLVRELLKRNTKVLLCATVNPAINDITFSELVKVIEVCCEQCEVLRKSYFDEHRLVLLGNDQIGPCLDFRMLSSGTLNYHNWNQRQHNRLFPMLKLSIHRVVCSH